jgi:sortase (surface protein transpeptidase)
MLTAGIAGIAYFSPLIVGYKPLPPLPKQSTRVAQVIKTAAPTPLTAPKSIPLNLKIPAIGLDANIITVGLNADGTMEVPDPNLSNSVGWYSYSPTPGEVGPSVIVGHVVDYVGPSVFWRLQELHPGDEIAISRQDSRSALFKVDDIRQYSQEDFPTSDVYGNINYAGLRLVTCGGHYNPATGHYTLNTVVYGSFVKIV